MARIDFPGWMRTRRFAIGASVLIHAGAIALFVTDRVPEQKEVVIEFVAPPQMDVMPVVVEDPVEQDEGVESEVATAGETAEQQGESVAAKGPDAALEAIMDIDLSALRADLVREDRVAHDRPVLAAGIGPIEPTIHLSEAEVDSLVTEGHEYGKITRKRGVKGRRQPTVCIPPR